MGGRPERQDMTNQLTAVVASVTHAGTSKSGNPTWRVGIYVAGCQLSFLTATDAQVGYVVHSGMIDRTYKITFSGKKISRIIGMTEVK